MDVFVNSIEVDELRASGTSARERQSRLAHKAVQEARLAHIAAPQEGYLQWKAPPFLGRKLSRVRRTGYQARHCFGSYHDLSNVRAYLP
jgi:hypothetical protein